MNRAGRRVIRDGTVTDALWADILPVLPFLPY
jgi:hypothetical protein